MAYPLDDKEVNDFEDAMHDVLMSLPEKEKFKKGKKQFLDNIWEELEYNVIDRMSETIRYHIYNMSSRVITSIIEGNEDQMKRFLGLDGYTGRTSNHKVIHGTLFETGAIKLRRKIAQAHADLIQNERILDLEDQVKSLVEEVNKKEQEIQRVRDCFL